MNAKRVLIYGGTTEGRLLAEHLAAQGIDCEVCVATAYGRQQLEESAHLAVRIGRMDAVQMRRLYEESAQAGAFYDAVVDATHPYATVVTKNIKESLAGSLIPYYRMGRADSVRANGAHRFFPTTEACVQALRETSGQILLATGSKELSAFCADPALRERLIVRVLPSAESIDLCTRHGLLGKQIVAMQGPFSKAMNRALMEQYDIRIMVSKCSGAIGGVKEKLAAADELKAKCFLIQRPDETGTDQGIEEAYTLPQICELLGVEKPKPQLFVTLAGIGMGGAAGRTAEVTNAIAQADYLFGARRMIADFWPKGDKFPYYRTEDIIPCLMKLREDAASDIHSVVLFSGDTGFYSGCEKLYRALTELNDVQVKILPGISSVAALSAKTGFSWQDARILSAHGVEESVWTGEVKKALSASKKIFLLTSGARDVRLLGRLLQGKAVTVYVGCSLSYEEESVAGLTPEECANVTADGLYVCLIVAGEQGVAAQNILPEHSFAQTNGAAGGAQQKGAEGEFPADILTPGIPDESFIRDQVPMTKEEVRTLSICKLRLTEDAVVYDIGSGTGSVTVEAARLSKQICVYALEAKPEAAKLTRRNLDKFGLENATVVEGLAPEALVGLPAPSHAFIGGSKGNLKEILSVLYEKNPRMRVVANAISLETVCELQSALGAFPVKNVEIVQVLSGRAKEAGSYHLMQANNPVYIYAFDFCE